MKKTNKKNTDKIFNIICFSIFAISVLGCLVISLFVRTRTVSLTMDIQKTSSMIEQLKTENRILDIEIQTLKNRDRVYVMASTNTEIIDSVTIGE